MLKVDFEQRGYPDRRRHASQARIEAKNRPSGAWRKQLLNAFHG
jgi:hypothetical protein